jgi:methionine-rich copper-binding protein CopC
MVVAALGIAVGAVEAHGGVKSSDPASGSTIEEPIDQVYIDFGVNISDDVEIAVLDPDEEPLPSETERISETEAIVHFDPLEDEGTYIARYLTTEPDAGHLLAGAISFDFGHASGGGGIELRTWIGVGALSLAILATGALFSLLRHRAGQRSREEDPGDAETPLTGTTQL